MFIHHTLNQELPIKYQNDKWLQEPPTAGRWIKVLVVWLQCETLYGSTEELQSPKLPIGVVCGSKAWCVTFFNRPVNVPTVFMAQ